LLGDHTLAIPDINLGKRAMYERDLRGLMATVYVIDDRDV